MIMAFNLEKKGLTSKKSASNNEQGNSKFNLNKSSNISNIDQSTTTNGSGKTTIYLSLLALFFIFGIWYFLFNDKSKGIESDSKTQVVINSNPTNLQSSDQAKKSLDNIDSNKAQIVDTQPKVTLITNKPVLTATTIIDKTSPKQLVGIVSSEEPKESNKLNNTSTDSDKPVSIKEGETATKVTSKSSQEPAFYDTNIKKLSVTFHKSSSKLLDLDYDAVNDIIYNLKKNNTKRIIVEGFSSSEGDIYFNQHLSETRARVFMAYLISKGISKQQISAIGKGIKNPVASNETELERQKNRRVELILQ